jgi:hypothetical protein
MPNLKIWIVKKMLVHKTAVAKLGYGLGWAMALPNQNHHWIYKH